MRLSTVFSASFAMLMTGCGIFSGGPVDSPPPMGPRQPATQPVAIGRIDDDREAENSENFFVAIVMAPIRWVGAAIELPVAQIRLLEGDTPSKAARMTTDSNSADNRRLGVTKLVEYSFAHRPPYTTRYEQMAQADPDPTVRAAALRACNQARDRAATHLFISMLGDVKETDGVRLEAAKGLCNLPDSGAVPTLLTVGNATDTNRDVRIASVDALKYYRSLEVGRALGNLLADRDFAVGWQARRSLVYMTHQDFKMDQGAWLAFIAGPTKPLE
ncbi:MAG TPA: HEAT repeat domain-containing protein [Tepidisphaeraceae bacterium]|jgi:hypothetical protein